MMMPGVRATVSAWKATCIAEHGPKNALELESYTAGPCYLYCTSQIT